MGTVQVAKPGDGGTATAKMLLKSYNAQEGPHHEESRAKLVKRVLD